MIVELKEILKKQYGDKYQLDVIEILKFPELVLDEDDVIATPTLIKYSPPPIRRIIGDISQKQKVTKFLIS